MKFLIAVTPSTNVTDVSRLLFGNKLLTVLIFGIVTLVRPLQPENAELPMLVTLLGIVRLVRPLQPENAELPMLVTLFGIVTLVNLLMF
jgi:hypothetical protein